MTAREPSPHPHELSTSVKLLMICTITTVCVCVCVCVCVRVYLHMCCLEANREHDVMRVSSEGILICCTVYCVALPPYFVNNSGYVYISICTLVPPRSIYGAGIPGQAKCPHYRTCRWRYFRGVRKAEFHCIKNKSKSVMYMYVCLCLRMICILITF